MANVIGDARGGFGSRGLKKQNVRGPTVLVDVARRWRGIRIDPADLEKLNALRAAVSPLAASA